MDQQEKKEGELPALRTRQPVDDDDDYGNPNLTDTPAHLREHGLDWIARGREQRHPKKN